MDVYNSNLRPISIIGSGTYSRVILCRHRNYKKNVCVKQISFNVGQTTLLSLINSETFILSQLKHPRIIKFLDFYMQNNFAHIVMEYVSGGTLQKAIQYRLNSPFTDDEIRNLFCDLLIGIEYLHVRAGIVHRDLKPENILLDINGRPKIADFGLSFIAQNALNNDNNNINNCYVDSNNNNNVENNNNNNGNKPCLGTPLYMAPESLLYKKCDFKSDIWSLGCILYELCCSFNPFIKARDINELIQMMTNSGQKQFQCGCTGHSNCISLDKFENRAIPLRILCEGMLAIESNERWNISQIVSCPWITMHYYKLYFDYDY